MESPEAQQSIADWSPRISFSYGFASRSRSSSPAHHSVHDPDFEFSSLPAADLTPTWHVLSADELFCDGKLRVADESPECGMRGSGIFACGDAVCRLRSGSCEVSSAQRKALTIRAGNAGSARVKAIARERDGRQLDLRSAEEDAERSASGRKEAYCRQEKERLASSRASMASAQKLDVRGIASVREARSGGEDLGQKRKCGAPTVKGDAASAHSSSAMGRKGAKSRSSASCEELGLERRSRDGRAAEMEEAPLPICRQHPVRAGGAMAGKCEDPRTVVKWREEGRKSKEDERSSVQQWRRFSRNPRSASMAVDDFSQLARRTCVSLENSRCPSPSRSFSLPATTPTSPTASGSSSSVFSASSSSSSRHSRRFKDFFRLPRPSPKDAENPSKPSRMPLSARFFFPFLLKSKEPGLSDTAPPSPPQAPHDRPSQETTPTAKCQIPERDLDSTQFARPPSEQVEAPKCRPSCQCRAGGLAPASDRSARSAVGAAIRPNTHRMRQTGSMDQGREGQGAVHGRDEIVWVDAGSYNRNGDVFPSDISAAKTTRASAVASAGAPARHHGKSSERPISYTASVRVTPVLNVPSCITPSLRNAKPSSNFKPFRLDRIFLRRNKAHEEAYSTAPPTNTGL